MTTLAPEARRNVSLFSSGNLTDAPLKFAKKKKDDGTDYLSVTDQPIFRSGTFRDSMGFQHTWDDFHMSQIVSNFDLLKGRNIFTDPPVRKGHGALFGERMDGLVGYVTSLRTEKMTNPSDGKEYTYLLASYDVLDKQAQEHIASGLWRHRSFEVGFYSTNDDAEFWPVAMGFAFVDIPAVEGLNFSKLPGNGSSYSIMFEKEAPVTTPTVDTTNTGTGGTGASAPAAEPTTPATPPAAPAQHAAPTPPVHKFSINGVETTDFAAVQAHITTLEQFRTETVETGRKNFVSGLAASNKILASAVPGLEEFALSLSDEQYKKWVGSFENAPAAQVLGNHSNGVTNPEGTPQTEADKQVEIDKGIIAQHKAAGMAQDVLEKTASYSRLKAKGLV